MSRTVCSAVCLAAIAASLAGQEPAAAQTGPKPANYVVHEWGTFTCMVGSDGIALEGLHHEEEALPKFVHDLLRIDEAGRDTDWKLPASRVTQKMETPVLYFHTDEPLSVQVNVQFQHGLMTQFYPLPQRLMPLLDEARQARAGRIDMSKVSDSMLVWQVDLLPRQAGVPAGIPAVPADAPWQIAREVDAAYVRTVPLPGTPAKAETEHYLFYRGLGRWQPGIGLHTDGNRVDLENRMREPVPFVAALELGAEGGRFVVGSGISGAGQASLALGAAPWERDRAALARRLGALVQQALERQGLYQDEARAMVATWSRSWFQKDGARVFYLLPRAQTDKVLPLGLAPAPKELVRVLVGRLEFITPAAQAAVEAALLDRQAADAARATAAKAVLEHLDRFLEPHLRQIAASGSTPAARQAAADLLAERFR